MLNSGVSMTYETFELKNQEEIFNRAANPGGRLDTCSTSVNRYSKPYLLGFSSHPVALDVSKTPHPNQSERKGLFGLMERLFLGACEAFNFEAAKRIQCEKMKALTDGRFQTRHQSEKMSVFGLMAKVQIPISHPGILATKLPVRNHSCKLRKYLISCICSSQDGHFSQINRANKRTSQRSLRANVHVVNVFAIRYTPLKT